MIIMYRKLSKKAWKFLWEPIAVTWGPKKKSADVTDYSRKIAYNSVSIRELARRLTIES